MANSLVSMEKLLDPLLAEPLMELGFERARRLSFQTEIPEVRQLLRFPTRIENNVMFFNANGAIRFENIEELLGNADPLSPTLMMPVHLLRPSKECLEWQFAPEFSGSLIDQVLADCRQYLLPFIARGEELASSKASRHTPIDEFKKIPGKTNIMFPAQAIAPSL